MKQERVDINIDTVHPPIHTLPDWNNFWLIPSHSTHLREFVMSVQWNHALKHLQIEIKETPVFSVFDWFSRFKRSDSPCSVDNKEQVDLVFFDENEAELARLKFEGLALANHKCVLDHNEEDEDNNLIHEITLRYNTVKRATSKDYELGKEPDDEWLQDKEPVWAETT